jgi:tRNA pseudouridine38-40 synthase
MTLAYDGTNYCGWQVQPNGTAIQTVVELALTEFTGEPIKAVASGRTDAGVHAQGQVVSFTTCSTAPCEGFLHGLACHLPEDIVVRDVQPAPSDFNARYDAKRKWYRYVIHNSRIRSPFLRNSVLWQRTRLDHVAMHNALKCLVGTHDFRCFETKWPNRSSSVRTVFHASVMRQKAWNVWQSTGQELQVQTMDMPQFSSYSGLENPDEAPFICFDIQADGFLYNMVRAMWGVADGRTWICSAFSLLVVAHTPVKPPHHRGFT